MKKIYLLFMSLLCSLSYAQNVISFEESEGYKPANIHDQNQWEVTEANGSIVEHQIITSEQASHGSFSFKNGYEPEFGEQIYPIFGAVKLFDNPINYRNLSISYDVLVNGTMGSDFEFTLFGIDSFDDWSPVAGVGMDYRGKIYVITSAYYDYYYLPDAEWNANTWLNIKIDVTENQIRYYVNGEMKYALENFSKIDILGFNMLHNNYGQDAYYDNIIFSSVSTAIDNIDANKPIIYFNPNNNCLELSSVNINTIAKIEIFDIAGRLVLTSDRRSEINIQSLKNGVYIVNLQLDNGSYHRSKILKQ